jgi:energy-coupling factor transporter ATP-binding protein EcfA2/SAM-dependent methyltransferase
MHIRAVDIPANWGDNGLAAIAMSRLSSVVILAGKNGSGKTRLLRTIQDAVSRKPSRDVVANAAKLSDELRPMFETEEELLAAKLVRLGQTSDPAARARLQEEIDFRRANVDNIASQLRDADAVTNWPFVQFDDLYGSYPIVSFVPKSTSLVDPRDLSPNLLYERAQAVGTAGVEHLAAGALPKIQLVQDRWFEASHPRSTTPPELKATAISDYERLSGYINRFLGASLGRTHDSFATIFGQPLADARMSEGQAIILQLCVAMFSQPSVEGPIIVLDEPENHLHPGILRDLIEELEVRVGNGQIWIATHSIPLLASFDPSCIWYVEGGCVSFAGASPSIVLADLLGGEEKRAQLRDFTDLPASHALYRHAFESLLEPLPVNTGPADPQTLQIRAEFAALQAPGSPLRVLDYGAGRGRLAANIADGDVAAAISYFAYDVTPHFRAECLANIGRLHDDPVARYFDDHQLLLTREEAESFDVVVMANVLHEIDPSQWLGLFGPGGLIPKLLKADGSALIVEDHLMPIGEKPYQKGYIVLDTPELKELFRVGTHERGFDVRDARGDNRLKAHRISRRLLVRITQQSRTAAMRSANGLAQRRVLELRAKPATYVNGRKHAFWVQQLANTQLCLSEWETSSSSFVAENV